MSWRQRRRSTNAVPFPSGLAKRREASSAQTRRRHRAEPVESTAAILAVAVDDASASAYRKQMLIAEVRACVRVRTCLCVVGDVPFCFTSIGVETQKCAMF